MKLYLVLWIIALVLAAWVVTARFEQWENDLPVRVQLHKEQAK